MRVPTPASPPALLLHGRRHIDLKRVAAALCRR
ncbi:putative leader peptide [Actinacidiphila polyblastidii]